MFVTCPDCLMRARLSRTDGRLVGYEGKCQHKKHPTKCPLLGASIAVIQKVLRQDGGSAWGPSFGSPELT
jgi:hypothetical protein